jgi:glutathione S-transferase
MKLYMTPGACSLADHIALHEANLSFDCVRVDIPARRTETGDDFTKVNPKGYVPVLALDDGQVLTENVAILSWIAERAPHLVPDGELGRIRMIEMLAFIASEVHKPFIRCFFPTSEADGEFSRTILGQRLDFLADQLQGDYLFGSRVSVADAYLFVMLRWAGQIGLEIPPPLRAFAERMTTRPAVRRALQDEGASLS